VKRLKILLLFPPKTSQIPSMYKYLVGISDQPGIRTSCRWFSEMETNTWMKCIPSWLLLLRGFGSTELSLIRVQLIVIMLIVVFTCLASAETRSAKSSGVIYTGGFVQVPGQAKSKMIATLSTDTDPVDDDITPPVVTFDLPAVWETTCSGQPTIHISGTATDDTGVVSVVWENQEGDTGTCTGTDSWSSSQVILVEGENLVCVTAVDSAGNVGASSVLITYNPNGPTVTITVPTTGYTYTTPTPVSSLAVSGTASGDRSVTQVTWSTVKGASGTCTGTDTWSIASVPLEIGNNTLLVTATDSAGEFGSKTLNIIVPDQVAPSVTIVSPTLAKAPLRIGASVPVSGTASDNTSLKQITWATDKGYNGTCTGTSNWSISQLPLEIGDNHLTVTATDDWDNVNTAQLTITRQQTTVASAWLGLTIAALPMVPDIADAKEAVGFIANSWASYDTDLGIYHTYPDVACWLQPKENTPGRGFWGAFATGTPDPLGYATPLDSQVTIHLYPGWNIVGNPYNTNLNWEPDRIRVRVTGTSVWASMSSSSDSVRDYAIGWQQDASNPLTGAYYPIAADTSDGVLNYMAPWRAVWIKAFEECDLMFPPPGDPQF